MFTMEYFFEMVQEIEVRVFDQDGDKPLADESKHDLIGSANFVLGKLMTAPNQVGNQHFFKLYIYINWFMHSCDIRGLG